LNGQDPRIIFRRPVQLRHHASLARFGASIATHHGGTYIIGGIVKDQMMTALDEACAFKIQDSQCSLSFLSLHHPPNAPRPLLIGSTVASAGDSLLVIGGSAVCFSFGTCWNKGCYTLHTPATISRSEKRSPKEDLKPSPECWKYLHTINTLVPVRSPKAPGQADLASRSLINIPRVQIRSPAEFNQIMRAANPVIIGGLDLGACTSKWTAEYLKEKVGEDREVSYIHNFVSKNITLTV
jgi:tRNA wybutosine-synthesizing protein 4